MFYLKACPRCHGDVYLRSDLDGWYLCCIQCAYIEDAEDPQSRPRAKRAAPAPMEAAAV